MESSSSNQYYTEKQKYSRNIESLSQKVAAVLSLVSALVASLIIIAGFVPGDISAYADIFRADLLKDCAPENDITAYAAFVVIYPTFYVVFIHLFRKLFEAVCPHKLANISSTVNTLWAISLSVFALVGIAVLYSSKTYAAHLYGAEKLPLVVICSAFLFAISFAHSKGKLHSATQISATVISLAFLLFVFFTVSNYNFASTSVFYNLHHYNAWWFPIYKVGSGMTIGTDFNNLYGFYPYLVVPVLKLFGGVNQQSMSLYVAVIFTLMAACLFGFCNRFFKNKLLGTISAAGAFALGPIKFIHSGKTYFQYYPARVLFVFIVLGLIVLYCTFSKPRPLFKAAGVIICALSLIWNIEAGVVATIIWLGFLILEKALDHRLTDPILIKRVAFAVVSLIVSVILFIGFVELATYLRAGTFLDLQNIIYGITVFSGLGFNMIPIKIHVWILIAAAMAYGLYVSIPHLALARKKNCTQKSDFDFTVSLFIISITGTGCFIYFMGRTYPEICMTFTPWATIICALLAERNILKIYKPVPSGVYKKSVLFLKRSGTILRNAVCFLVAGIAMTASFSVIADALDKNSKINLNFTEESHPLNELAEQFTEWTDTECNGETPNILIYYSVLVQELMEVPAKETVYNQPSWFYYSDIYTYIDFINTHKNEAFIIDSSATDKLKKYFPEEWSEALNEFTLCRTTETKLYQDKDEIIVYYLYLPATTENTK